MPPPLIANLQTAKKLGIIVPSSNTAVEALTISLLNSLKANIIPIFTRIRVLTLGTDASSKSQFTQQAFLDAAQLLADAEADAILWNGTSGMFLGTTLAEDKALANAMTEACGVPCSTNTIATIAALQALGDLKDVSISVPYTPQLTSKLHDFFTSEGYRVHRALCMDQTPPNNIAIAKCSEGDISDVIRRAVTPDTKAVVVACTNFPATPIAAELERDLGIYVLDSIAVTAWYGLRMIGVKATNGNMSEWGRLFETL